MNFKDTFLKLTEWTIPFGHESELEHLLPSGWKKDSVGNYYYQIGTSETLFTSHLDVSTDKKEKVNHIINGNIIKTDGTTILGGDNKAGCCVLFYMIENFVPGTYYFFLGEEGAVHKDLPHGSLLAIESNPEFFKKFKRAVSFDRKEKGQLITRQFGRSCCSDEFADKLIEDFKSNGIDYQKDRTGYYTDTAFFGDLIPEIVNLSVGVYNEHTTNEYVDIKYVESVAKAAIKIKWDNLPTVRLLDRNYQIDSRLETEEIQLSNDQKIFQEVFTILDNLYYVCQEVRSYKNYLYHFKSGRKYHFTKWHEDDELEISVQNGLIYMNDLVFNNLEDFKKHFGIEKLNRHDFYNLIMSEFDKNDGKLTDAQLDFLIYQKGANLNKFGSDLKKNRKKLQKIGKGYQLVRESILMNYSSFIKNNIYN
jgi:hypothetical protein